MAVLNLRDVTVTRLNGAPAVVQSKGIPTLTATLRWNGDGRTMFNDLQATLYDVSQDIGADEFGREGAVIWWNERPEGSGQPRPFLKDLGKAIGGFLKDVGKALGGVASWVADVLSSPLGRAAVTGMCTVFTGGNVAACTAGTKALAQALATAGGAPVRIEQADAVFDHPGYRLSRFNKAWVVHPPGTQPDEALQRGLLGLWAPGFPQWINGASVADNLHDLELRANG